VKTKILLLLAVALTAGLVLQPLFAVPVTYIYTGNPFTNVSGPYTTSDQVTAKVKLSSPLPANMSLQIVTPLAFSFSDGVQTFTNLTASSSFEFQTDASGNIFAWNVGVVTAQAGIFTVNTADNVFDKGFSDDGEGEILRTPGTWSRASVPDVASTFTLLALSTTALGVAARRWKPAGDPQR
jgi:hypothetical protein